ncbi:RagB/SusD family nutrient uptake outer membrane protein [Rhodohalobacter halophilus]|uniref:RagB/SusD family nutrient uptake outer membrane protein n=1 Tax=Rhodohalobacter halophilus TaxID=1812810 RepID=UPI00083FAC49|nr:RagB/SusD family nutrient uptake outer membrane protein [Rhodohalobacter halophilus]
MKKLSILLITILAVFLISCDVLDTEPQASLDANTALTDGASAQAVLLGAYSRMQVTPYYGAHFTLSPDLAADNARYQGFFDSQLEINSGSVPISNFWISTAWVNIYRVVNIANLLIAEVPNIADDAFSSRDRVLGEAHAIRALAYFDLLRVFGYHFDVSSPYGMPLLLEPIENNDFNLIPDLERSGVADTYQQILDDLNTAIGLMQGYVDNTAMSYWAAVALRARVNLYAGNYGAAFDDADDVIENGPFSLVEDVQDLFDTTSPTSESIFDLVFSDQDQSSLYVFTFQRDEYNVDPDLTGAIEAGDDRAGLFVFERGSDRPVKWSNPNNANNVKVLRLGEMFLIRSEAAVFDSNDPNAGLDDLNEIRDRAGLGDVGPFANIDEYVDALLQERRIELNYEGHRFFDLVRLDRFEDVLNRDSFRRAFPIPRDELQIQENLDQNPGYPIE